MNYKYSLILLLAIGSSVAYDAQHTQNIKQEMLSGQSFANPQSESPIVQTEILENIKKLFKPYQSSFTQLGHFDALRKAWDELPTQTPGTNSIIDRATIRELELIRGNGSNLIDKITGSQNNRLSVVGEKRCAEMLCMPQISQDQLSVRRDFIKSLSSDSELLNEVKSLLQTLKESEPYVLDFYGKDGISEHEKAVYPGIIVKALLLDETPSAITTTNRSWAYSLTPALVPTAQATAILASITCVVYNDKNVHFTTDTIRDILSLTGAATYQVTTSKTMLTMLGVMSPIYMANFGMIKSVSNAIKDMQERAIGFATYVRTAKRLMALLNNNPDLAVLMPLLKDQLNRLEGNDTTVPAKYLRLNDLLQNASTFNPGEPSALSSPGNTLVAYKYLCDKDIRAQYASVMNMVGEIDVYTCLADKISAHDKEARAPFCFVDFVEGSEKPILEVQDFWHPFIDAENVVSNSVSLNTGNERNMMITGPNTGGKSTTMKALASSVLLAQTFGIAPASSMRMTPFSAICSYLNVNDDISSGLSLFKAEVKRVQDLMKTIKNLPNGSYAFVMLDEIFTGTSPDKAEELAYECFKKLSAFDHVIFVGATHFKKNTELEDTTNGTTKNYQTEAITDANDNVVEYTYKLIPGISKINSAQQIVDEAYLDI